MPALVLAKTRFRRIKIRIRTWSDDRRVRLESYEEERHVSKVGYEDVKLPHHRLGIASVARPPDFLFSFKIKF
jgi:hypothetical protein